jgi:hypothetical protein
MPLAILYQTTNRKAEPSHARQALGRPIVFDRGAMGDHSILVPLSSTLGGGESASEGLSVS